MTHNNVFPYMLVIAVAASVLLLGVGSVTPDVVARRVYYLSAAPRYFASSGPTAYSTGTVLLVAWVEAGRSIDLSNALSVLTGNGFQVVDSSIGDGYIEVSKHYYCFPDMCSGAGCPGATVYVRVYGNGSMYSYVLAGYESIGVLGYMDNSTGYVVPLPGKVLGDVLALLGLSSRVPYISYGLPSHPSATHIVFIYPSTYYVAGGGDVATGYYTVSSSATVYAAGFIHMNYVPGSSSATSRLYIDSAKLTTISAANGQVAVEYVELDPSQYMQPGTSHYVRLNADAGTYSFFLITIVAGQ